MILAVGRLYDFVKCVIDTDLCLKLFKAAKQNQCLFLLEMAWTIRIAAFGRYSQQL